MYLLTITDALRRCSQLRGRCTESIRFDAGWGHSFDGATRCGGPRCGWARRGGHHSRSVSCGASLGDGSGWEEEKRSAGSSRRSASMGRRRWTVTSLVETAVESESVLDYGSMVQCRNRRARIQQTRQQASTRSHSLRNPSISFVPSPLISTIHTNHISLIPSLQGPMHPSPSPSEPS